MSSGETSSGTAPGTTALVVPVPELEAVVADVRRRHDPSAAAGVPAHLTVVFPFLPLDRVGPDVRAELARLVAAHVVPETVFARFGRFPGLLYLAPDPAAPLRALTAAVVARWPEAPPYGGRHPDVVPHLTLTTTADEAQQRRVERELAPSLPVSTRPGAVVLLGYDGRRWAELDRFGLSARPGPARPGPGRDGRGGCADGDGGAAVRRGGR